jgi:transmembrane sensor
VRVFPSRHDRIEARAAKWVVRLSRSPLRNGEYRALDRWLAKSPAHAAAFDHARSIWTDLSGLKWAPGALLEELVPQRELHWARASPQPTAGRVGLRIAVVAAVMVVAAGLGIFWFGDPLLALEADYRTAPGESRSITLTDGSIVQLDTDSALVVQFDARERRVGLLAGEAYFTVAPTQRTETRPLVVVAASGTTTALGTRFAVERVAGGAEVVVADHEVQVSATAGHAGVSGSVVLWPGQRVRYDAISGIGAITQIDPERATAWRHGQLIFDKVRLADVVAELNRYRRGRIVIVGADLAERRVSGVFETADLPAAVSAIARELKARIAALPPFVTILY